MRGRGIRRGLLGLGLAVVISTSLSAGGQTPATGRLMREKLTHAQQLLEALTTSNFAMLERESTALAKIPGEPAWRVLTSPEYRRYSETFLRATEDLVASAKQRDLDQAAMNYQAMTMSCYQCHRYIKALRIAGAPAARP